MTHLEQLTKMLSSADVLHKITVAEEEEVFLDAYFALELTHSGNYPCRFLFDKHGQLTSVEVES